MLHVLHDAGNIVIISRVDHSLLNNGFTECHSFIHAKIMHKFGLDLLSGFSWQKKMNKVSIPLPV